jgi:hypothetical protein
MANECPGRLNEWPSCDGGIAQNWHFLVGQGNKQFRRPHGGRQRCGTKRAQ